MEAPDAARRVQAIIESPSYRQADGDVDRLHRTETRGLRLLVGDLETELLLERHDVRHTIVAFGSTRILVDEGVIDAEHRKLFWYAETAQDIRDGSLRWHILNGEPLHGNAATRSL